MADELAACLENPQYKGKTFGMIVLQGRRQVKELEHEIIARVSPEEREKRKIRVGVASDFQGDERDIVFLSMVVADPPRAQKWTIAQQTYNVAASRAKDQLWLFTSISMSDLKSDDLRASLLGYMQNPPSTYGDSPALDDVSDTSPCHPFESLLEQRVFRKIRGRGYHVVPQYAVGSRRLDLVIVGDGTRVAVECDGHRYHTSPDQVASDARRDRELSRMKWQVIRVRESEFEFDRERELAPLWTALKERGIAPVAASGRRQAGWAPVPLAENGEGDPQEDGDD
jgi:very-short-patch-repair endonuclease